MSILDETNFIERLQFFNGQRVSAADLQGIEAFNREMRWLHNTSLHQPGIGSGFAVGGSKGDREVTISPGYAIDALGREIVLTQPLVESVPPVAADGAGNSIFYDLTVSYPDDSELETAESQAGVCLPRGVVRLREEPVFCWVQLEMTEEGLAPKDATLGKDIQTHRRIILAQIEVFNCQLNRSISIAERLDARPDVGPYIACGRVGIDSITIEESKVSAPVRSLIFTGKVDTTESDFRTTPCYSAHFEGSRVMSISPDNKIMFGLIDFLQILEAGQRGFTVHAFVVLIGVEGDAPSRVDLGLESIKKTLIDNAWKLVWMGIEG